MSWRLGAITDTLSKVDNFFFYVSEASRTYTTLLNIRDLIAQDKMKVGLGYSYTRALLAETHHPISENILYMWPKFERRD